MTMRHFKVVWYVNKATGLTVGGSKTYGRVPESQIIQAQSTMHAIALVREAYPEAAAVSAVPLGAEKEEQPPSQTPQTVKESKS